MSGARLRGLRRVLRIGMPEREMEDELAFHFAATVEELVESGWDSERAREEAARRFGDEAAWRSELRAVDRSTARGKRWSQGLEASWQTLRYAVRRLRRAPALTVVVVATFALGIGANAAMFQILDRLLLSPPPHIGEPEEVRRLLVEREHPVAPGELLLEGVLSFLDYESLAAAGGFSGVAAERSREFTLGRGEGALPIRALLVTGNYFDVLRARPHLGRYFGPAEDEPGEDPVVVLGYRLWQERFGGDPEAVGSAIDLGVGQFTVIGVAPRGFTGKNLQPVDLLLPLYATHARLPGGASCFGNHNCVMLEVVGRVAPALTPPAAEAEATALLRHGRSPDVASGRYDAEARVIAAPLIVARGPEKRREPLIATWLAVVSFLVLLIACANVANLLLARAVRQQREIGVRGALGGSRRRIVSLVLAEALLLAGWGGVAALLVSAWIGGLIRRSLLPGIDWSGASSTDGLGIVLVLTLVAGLSAALIPMIQTTRYGIHAVLSHGGRATAGGSRVRNALSTLQAALCVGLLWAAGALVHSLHRVRSVELGLDPRDVLVVTPTFEQGVSRTEEGAFRIAAAEHLRNLPTVASASVASTLPFFSVQGVSLRVPGLDSIPTLPGAGPYYNAVDPDFFGTLGVRLLRGRPLSWTDDQRAPPVVVVSELTARLLWPGEEAIGKCVVVGGSAAGVDGPCREVVGVASDVRRFSLVDEGQALQLYVPLAQWGAAAAENARTLVMRLRPGQTAAVVPQVQRELTALDPRLRAISVEPFRAQMAFEERSWRMGATLFSAFGLLALIVAAIGLYGVLAFNVAQRSMELGIRSALGASRRALVGLVVSQSLRIVLTGIALGLLATLFAAKRLEPLLFETSPWEPVVVATVLLLVLSVGVLASLPAAARAARVDPQEALRSG